MKPVTPFGYTIFCDDIRHEIGNKTTLVGLYQGVMAFDAEFPITIPKLCMVVTWVQSTSEDILPVTLKVFNERDDGDERLIIEGQLPVEGFRNAPKISADATMLTAQAHIVVSPLTVDTVGSVKVRATYADEEYRVGRLHIIRGPIQVVTPDPR